MKYSPKPEGRGATLLIILLLVISLSCYFFSGTGLSAPLPLQLISLVSICAAAYILVRYKLTSTAYFLKKRDDSAFDDEIDFCVTRGQGRRAETLECVLSLSCLVDAVDLKKWDLADIRKRYKGARIYNYTASLCPRDRLALLFDDEGEVSCIIIEPDATFAGVIREFSKKNKEKLR